jgi:hypothetical protein
MTFKLDKISKYKITAKSYTTGAFRTFIFDYKPNCADLSKTHPAWCFDFDGMIQIRTLK